MICDLCGEHPKRSLSIRLCAACSALAEQDRRGTMRAALERRAANRNDGHNRKWRDYRRRKRAAGLCAYGGCNTPSEVWYCRAHMARHGQQSKECKHRARAAGYCMVCVGRPAEPGRVICAFCRARTKRLRAARAARRLAAGRCRKCGSADVGAGMKHCRPCLEASKADVLRRIDRRRQSGLCIRCGGRRDSGRLTCEPCLHRARLLRRVRLLGADYRPEPPPPPSTSCAHCGARNPPLKAPGRPRVYCSDACQAAAYLVRSRLNYRRRTAITSPAE